MVKFFIAYVCTYWDFHCKVLLLVSLIGWMIYFHSHSLQIFELKCKKSQYVWNKNFIPWKVFVDVSQLMNKNRLCVLSMEYSLYMTLHQLLIFWCSANNINCDKKCSYLYRGWVDPSVWRPSKLLQDCILDKIPFRIQQD